MAVNPCKNRAEAKALNGLLTIASENRPPSAVWNAAPKLAQRIRNRGKFADYHRASSMHVQIAIWRSGATCTSKRFGKSIVLIEGIQTILLNCYWATLVSKTLGYQDTYYIGRVKLPPQIQRHRKITSTSLCTLSSITSSFSVMARCGLQKLHIPPVRNYIYSAINTISRNHYGASSWAR